jgi:hypothetical protein
VLPPPRETHLCVTWGTGLEDVVIDSLAGIGDLVSIFANGLLRLLELSVSGVGGRHDEWEVWVVAEEVCVNATGICVARSLRKK